MYYLGLKACCGRCYHFGILAGGTLVAKAVDVTDPIWFEIYESAQLWGHCVEIAMDEVERLRWT